MVFKKAGSLAAEAARAPTHPALAEALRREPLGAAARRPAEGEAVGDGGPVGEEESGHRSEEEQ